jgi:hypothetical protein
LAVGGGRWVSAVPGDEGKGVSEGRGERRGEAFREKALEVWSGLREATPGGEGGDVVLVVAEGKAAMSERGRKLCKVRGGGGVGVGDKVGGGGDFVVEEG